MSLFRSETMVVERDTDGSLHLKLDVPGKSMNVITRQVFTDLDAALDTILAQGSVPPLLVIRSGKKTGFLAGADLAEFLDVTDTAGARALSERGQRLFDKLANFPCPTLVAIHGPCLGGGLELALACDYRLVVDSPRTQLGLPEVELGLLPAWGGTQRLPRVVGLEPALQMILGQQRLDAQQALKWGLADALATTEEQLREAMVQLSVRAVGSGKRPLRGLPLRTWRQWFLESNALGRRLIYQGTERRLRARVPEDMPAPGEALEAVRIGLLEGMPTGLTYEREAAARLALTPACRNLIGLFFQREAARKVPEGGAEVRKLGLVGAGVMGAGIAQLAALRGLEVAVQEVNADALQVGMKRIDDLFAKAVERRIVGAAEGLQRRAAIRGTVAWEGFDGVEVVVEAAVEDLAIKQNLFRELERRTGPQTILATNTSSLTVASLQEGLQAPGRVAGLHFFNPVHKMPLVEVVRGPKTDEETVRTLVRLAITLGKTPVVVGDGPGFVVNRILMPYLNEAVLLVREGLSIAEVDGTMKRFGMPMGPLELLDQIGLDVAAHVVRSIGPAFAGRFEPNEAFGQMQQRGWLGVKGGKGFYLHGGKKPVPNPEVEQLLRSPEAKSAVPLAERLAEARERMVLLMVNEAVLVREERLAEGPAIDLAMVFGTGWAPHRGGPLRYAADRGQAEVAAALRALAARYGRRFEPAPGLGA